MEYSGLSYIIIFGFLLITLILGLWAGRNIKTIEDYAIASKSYGVGILMMTYLATFIGASHLITIPSSTYKFGIIVTLPTLTIVSVFLLIGFYIAPKILRFKGILTMGELMGTLFGYHARLITGIIGFLFSIFVVGGQITALSKVLSGFFPIDPKISIFLIGLLVVIYSSKGGIRGVTITDMLQFFTLIIVIITIAGKIVNELGGLQAFYDKINIIDKSKISIIDNPKYKTYIKVTFKNLMPVFLLSPPFIQRMLMVKDKTITTRVFITTSIFYVILRIAIAIVSIGVFLLFPMIDSKMVFVHSLKLFPAFLHGFIICGFLSIIISSIDSFLNAAGLLVTCDVIKPIARKYNMNFDELKQVKNITLIIGLISIIIASFGFTCHQVLFFAMNILSTLIVPLITGIIGIKPFKKDFYAVLISSLIFYLIMSIIYGSPYNLYHSSFKNSVMIYNLLLCTIIFFLSHFINNKGLVILKKNKNNIKEEKYSYIQIIKPEINTKYTNILCILILVVNILLYFSLGELERNLYMYVSIVRMIGAILCILILLKDIWPNNFKNKFLIVWFTTLVFCLPFSSTIYILMGTVNEYAELVIILNIIAIYIITDMKGFALINLIGIPVAFFAMAFTSKDIDFTYIYLIIILSFPILILSKFIKERKYFFTFLKSNSDQKYEASSLGRHKGLSNKAKKKAKKAVLLYQQGDLLTTEICEKLDISRPTFYKYLELSGIKLKSKNPKKE